eukprot:CAMPEP_0198732004 /NCGR_PEP_ID=MMETSP1475-20131203/33271_1 /TAXON_ID= ORGANISM="Unidentified sp., Strain CCMP1999" /NCGR_SAMPLE_ID=MMETSP1475 /ASSEMBLY_ACC=CAM_ASM_001111 /LENGTH=248 /DNA_ID=CAMNT_0044495035 /DNA_START=222 /DNA_END=968 /DNA_ORIENTATION=+
MRLAKLAEQAERYEDMVSEMRQFATNINKDTKDLTDEERNFLSVAYKNVVGQRRASWRVISSLEQKETNKGNETRMAACKEYRKHVESELEEYCSDILNLVREHLLPAADASNLPESRMFYWKMMGDYYRYLAELTVDADGSSTDAAQKALESYNAAMQVIKSSEGTDLELKPTNPSRLGLALNFSVFYYEIMRDTAQACALAKDAFDNAVADLDKVSSDSDKDVTLIIQLLRDNLSLWTQDGGDADE